MPAYKILISYMYVCANVTRLYLRTYVQYNNSTLIGICT
jgi:hypothetical protein